MKGEILIDREALREVVRELLAEESSSQRGGAPSPTELLDEETRRDVQEQVRIANKTYLTRKEAAKYLAVSERSISEWVARTAGENPLPERRAGGEPRYKREDVDAWVEREARRQRLKLAG
jgi:excisionase family DNA binding protein